MSPASVRIEVGVATDRAQRASNEDALHAADGVYVVADGMGGHESGEVASRTAVDTLQVLSKGVPDLARARAVLRAAHKRVRALPAADALRRPGTTASGVVLSEHDGMPCWLVLNVGDSRTYRMAGGVLEQVTQDHSEVAELVARGVVPAQEAAHHPRRNVVTRALGGGSATVDPDVFWLPVSPGDRMLVCSDGLTDEVPDSRIEAELKAEPDPQAAAERLVDAALAAGGSDNVTVLVVDATVRSARAR
ncbi:PP2C family serine/threonine-protein phosphatase [Cellulomonas sp. PhB150]|uniref:PP2C family protein-serine/threonine phosphatase n=1 Tax=Cellulomonas sp. PhB150 TaxID=2485188 RepID=UPI000F4793C1|nr:protein phosphatase 2C domain-containing protein [Cellulomonas sp. PhB150]ROS31559.1 protein phosphatase [Cellulomonas sp. PhB150]